MRRLCAFIAPLTLLAIPLAIAGANSHRPARSAGLRRTIPRDFSVVAQYGPGESDAKWWTTTIRADGRALQTVYGKPEPAKRLSRIQLAQLMTVVRQQQFWGLSREYRVEEKDGPTLLLTVTANGRTRRVAVFYPSDRQPSKDVRRFLRVWSTVLRLVPSPNPEQTPAAYLR